MADIERPSTPPQQRTNLSQQQSTPEHIRQIEINRLRAKAAQRQREKNFTSPTSLNANNKRPIAGSSTAAASSSTSSSAAPLKRDSRLGTYFEYDLSKMVNSKGGFLLNEGNGVDEDLRRREKERERQRQTHNVTDLPVHLDPERNPRCQECNKIGVDPIFMNVFNCLVCKACQDAKPERYSLLTKTECKEDYLLTDRSSIGGQLHQLPETTNPIATAELRDRELLPHLLKANPHKSTYANMMLFLRYQVEEFAWKKWGSPEALDAEYVRRVEEKKGKKNKKFEQSLKDLRRRTKEGVWQRRKDAEHKHVFGQVEGLENGVGKQVCHECGFTIEVEEL